MSERVPLLITAAEVEGRHVDVRVRDDRVVDVAAGLRPEPGDEVVDAAGGALLPGLHDHHIHLLSLAASSGSIWCGPPHTTTADGLAAALRSARPGRDGWVRGSGYHARVAGPLDRWGLDRLVADRPVRVQHRSGGLWVVNSAGVDRLGLSTGAESGIERDADGAPTGRLWRLDRWLRQRTGGARIHLGSVGLVLAGYGVTGVTDATPDVGDDALAAIEAATGDGSLPQRVHLLGAPAGWQPRGRLTVGPMKLLLPDHDLPPFDEVVGRIRAARADGRAVAVHCVTRESLVLTVAALDEVGAVDGDRLEHAAVVPPELVATLVRLGVRVVTQPGLVAERGDDYLAEVDPDDLPHLYPYASLLAAGVPTVASTDAPFAHADPWWTLCAARDRRTPSGHVVSADERVDVATALRGLLSPLDDPGGPPRRVTAGAPADLCLLRVPLHEALRGPTRQLVRLTVCDGVVVAGP